MDTCKIIPSLTLVDENSIKLCEELSNNGADELLVFDYSSEDGEHEYNISLLKSIKTIIDIPFIAGGNVNRLEDVKKYLYAGADKVFLDASKVSNLALIKEASERFGKDKIAIYIIDNLSINILEQIDFSYISLIITENTYLQELKECSVDIKTLLLTNDTELEQIGKIRNIYGITMQNIPINDIMDLKKKLKNNGVNIYTLTSTMNFSEFTLNNDKLIPVVVQDYKTNEVLMMAYMNEESYQLTIATGKMTYYSRSRKEIWVKGLTSGHFQYVKELRCDCDNDTLLAKVFQVGGACHTGNHSCFFNTLIKKEVKTTNPFEVFQDVFKVILDRKENPKEGSYTNYLFDKGLDKILKKLGEEATEIIIAAKNPDPEEIKYEISDFLYHMMVLMADKGVSWEQITEELNRR